MHGSCERLMVEKDNLLEFADALKEKLEYFDELDRMAAKLHGGAASVGDGEFFPLLKRLDECLEYCQSNPQCVAYNL